MTDTQLRTLARRGGFWLRISKRGRVIATREHFELMWDYRYIEKYYFSDRDALARWLPKQVEEHEARIVAVRRELL